MEPSDFENGVLAAVFLVLVTVGCHGSRSEHGAPVVEPYPASVQIVSGHIPLIPGQDDSMRVLVSNGFIPIHGEAGLLRCDTVVTDWGACLAPGLYEGNPNLLMGTHPQIAGRVTIDFHGASSDRVPCPADSSADVCVGRLPFGMATMTVETTGGKP